MRLTVVVFVILFFLVVGALNFAAVRALLRIHPRRRPLIWLATILGNAMWPFLPLLNARTSFSRFVRAVLGPPWFSWLVFVILYCALLALVGLVWIPLRKRRSFPALGRWPSRVFLALTLVASIAGCYQALVPLRIERVNIAVKNLPASAEGMKVAVLADLHVGLFSRPSRVRQFFATAAELRPDVVLIAGDLIDDDPYFVPKLLHGAESLGPSTPLLATLGNHEIYGDPYEVIDELRGSRIRLLVNEGVPMRGLWIAGISDFAAQDRRLIARAKSLRPDVDAALAGAPRGSFPLLFAHQPKAFDLARKKNLPLTLVAHTHGGQCGFRPLRWSLAGVFLPYHMGLYRRGDSQLYVNTGTGFWLVPFRLGMTGEITLVELHRE